MILIIGSSHDDIIYFESIIKNKKEEVILNRFHATNGTIFNQAVMLIHDVYSSYISSSLTTYLMSKYFVLLVFVVGKCTAASSDVRLGDIAISRRIMFGDVNLSDIGTTQLCQLPGLPRVYDVQQDVIQTLSKSLSNRTYSRYVEANFVSANVHFKNPEDLRFIREGDSILGFNSSVVLDSETGGIALAGYLANIPVISVKAVGAILGKESTTDDYLLVLKQYASIGRAIVSTIGEFSRNDVIRTQ